METNPSTEGESAFEISVCKETDADDVDPLQLTRAIEFTLTEHGRDCCSVSIALVDDAAMSKLHDEFMGDASPTDVLTFDLADNPGDPVEGHIVISVDTAERESRRRNLPRAAEVLLYAVHGTLHLLGYDDHDEHHAQAMHAQEDRILGALGIGPVYGVEPS